jgi:cysteine desulfurase
VLCAVTDGFGSELQVMMCDLDGVMVSAGSACSSGKVTNSAVLTAMGMMGLAGFAVRASGGWATVEDDWTSFADVWVAAHERHARRRSVA